MKSLHHSFDIDLAQHLRSVEAAIIVHHFQHWIKLNQAKGQNFYDGSYWTYQTLDEIKNVFPYMTKEKIIGSLDLLCKGKTRKMKEKIIDPILKKGCYNQSKYDKTVWYAFIDETVFLQTNIHHPTGHVQSRESTSPTPIPDTKPYSISSKEDIHVDDDDVQSTITSKPSLPDQCFQLSHLLFDLVKSKAPKAKIPKWLNWAKEIDIMHRDGYSWDEIEQLIRFAHNDDFWYKNIHSTKKLRSNAVPLTLKMKPTHNNQKDKQQELSEYFDNYHKNSHSKQELDKQKELTEYFEKYHK